MANSVKPIDETVGGTLTEGWPLAVPDPTERQECHSSLGAMIKLDLHQTPFSSQARPMQQQQPRFQRLLTTFASHAERESVERGEWRKMTPVQRLQAVETMRQLNHPEYDPATSRVQRFYAVA